MDFGAQMLLLLAVGGVGVLHTMVPDHWLPIALLAREQGWSRAETLRAAVQAGAGHAASTLIIALIVWIAGVAFARHFGHAVDVVSSLALIGFGGWIMLSASRELRAPQGHQHRHETRFTERDGDHHHHHETYDLNPDPESDPLYLPLRGDVVVLTRHIHVHRHGSQVVHAHWHDHTAQSSHELTEAEDAEPPLHEHRHRMKRRTALLLILG
ncbi:MAG TPA: hypothetical protein VG848_15765, partial [Acetobacteraceae bacterium]|nr:hypothetical protein [Acetobacteraceae bacterium]